MAPISYDIANLIGLALVTTGAIRQYGLDRGLIAGGTLLIALNVFTLLVAIKRVKK